MNTLASASLWNNESNLYLMNGKSLGNFNQTFISIVKLKNTKSEDYEKL